MAYTDIDDPSAFFNSVLWTGNGVGGTNITGVGFQPDLVWIKRRSAVENHVWNDAVRGVPKNIYSSLAQAEDSGSLMSAIISDGFTVQTDASVNVDGSTYVAWNWKAGTSFTNDASSTSIGSIDSAGSFNNDAGFSIVTYTAGGAAATIKHGLSSAPKMIFTRRLNGSPNWGVYYGDPTDYLELNTTAATQDDANMWNDTAPTSSVFSVGGDNKSSGGGNYVAYCFAEKKGYSKFGTYTGNDDDDGAFVYTGFKPAFVMVKITAGQTDNWIMQDNKINSFNGASSQRLRPNSSGAEFSSSNEIDLLSNGFKTHGADGEINGSGFSYIYMAFAESPFVTSTGIPTTAR